MVNVGTFDRAARIILGLVLIALPFVPAAAAVLVGLGNWIWVLPAVGAILVLTGLFRFCPAYVLFGINTCPLK